MDSRIPSQYTGKKLDCFKSLEFSGIEEANQQYEKIKARLLDVNRWHEITGRASADFEIVAPSGSVLERPVRKGDYIRIDIPGPGVPSAGGYDWVQVEDMVSEETPQFKRTVLTLRPCPDPTRDRDDTAHFFKHIATSTLLAQQKDNQVLLQYAGRNEVINTENVSVWDNFRNFLVGLGAKLGASFPQWKALIEGLGEPDKSEKSEKSEESDQGAKASKASKSEKGKNEENEGGERDREKQEEPKESDELNDASKPDNPKAS